jgi:hypothetical protein
LNILFSPLVGVVTDSRFRENTQAAEPSGRRGIEIKGVSRSRERRRCGRLPEKWPSARSRATVGFNTPEWSKYSNALKGHGFLRWVLKTKETTRARLLAYVTGLVNQELLLQNEYLSLQFSLGE